MKRNYQNRGFRHGKSRFPSNNKKPSRYAISESDLIRSIEYSKQSSIIELEETTYSAENTFEDFHVNFQLLKNIKAKGFIVPSPIQDKAIPVIMSGKDLIGMANTGTGKTAAFLIPLIEKVVKDRSQKVLIITPTRELAEQIINDLRSLSFGLQINSATIIGGNNMRTQIRDLQRIPNFVIGTPGRIKDMINRKLLQMSLYNNVVLDETDRMVDIGFIREIQLFISLLPKNRQSLFFSATIPSKVEQIIHAFVQNAVTVSVKETDTCKNIKQDYIRVRDNQQKVDYLHDLLIKEEFEKVIVFGNTKWKVQKLADELIKRGFKAAAIHGDKRQSQRHAILEKFKKSEVNILLATDVAARGLDINNVSHVINYEMPETYDDYIHRIGRTGRANKSGVALTFVNS